MKRIITKNDESGLSYIVSTDIVNIETPLANLDNKFKFYNLWATNQMPVDLKNNDDDPTYNQYISTTPAPYGSMFRIVNYPPESQLLNKLASYTKDELTAFENTIGIKLDMKGKHPLMHMTHSIDYGIVLKGEIYLVLGKEEILLKPFDTVIQRGTYHAWSNRSSDDCLMAYVLLDASL